MGEGAARRGLGRRHPRPGLGTRKIHPPRWTLGTDTSSQIGGPLARQYRTAQNIWKKRLRISGTHNNQKRSSVAAAAAPSDTLQPAMALYLPQPKVRIRGLSIQRRAENPGTSSMR